jgi:hypothetical protein
MSKKWYNYFVSVEPSEGSAGGPPQGPSGGAGGSADSSAQAVADIVAGLGAPPKFTAPAPGRKPTSFDEIYAAAEIAAPTHGYTILKVAEMLQSEHIRNLPAGVKKSSILLALDAAGVKLQEVIEDALKRDRALDTYERVQQKSIDDLQTKKDEENRRIQQEMERVIAEQKAKIQANSDEVSRAVEAFRAWRVQKQQEEQGIYDAVSYFVTENPITTSSSSPEAPPPPSKGKS